MKPLKFIIGFIAIAFAGVLVTVFVFGLSLAVIFFIFGETSVAEIGIFGRILIFVSAIYSLAIGAAAGAETDEFLADHWF